MFFFSNDLSKKVTSCGWSFSAAVRFKDLCFHNNIHSHSHLFTHTLLWSYFFFFQSQSKAQPLELRSMARDTLACKPADSQPPQWRQSDRVNHGKEEGRKGGSRGCENISTNKRDRDKESTLTQSLQQRHQDKIKQQDSAPHCTWEEQEVTQTPWTTTAAAAAGLPPGFRHAGGETPEIPDPDRHFSN